MGALIRARDWSSSPLGPIEGWSAALKSALGICLGTPAPAALWWGRQVDELIVLYNDAYRAILGARHPQALGARGGEVDPEAWAALAPRFRAVLAGQSAWDENEVVQLRRNGYPETASFAHVHSPVRDETGAVAGMLTLLMETTAERRAARRLVFEARLGEALRDLSDPAVVLQTAARLLAEHMEAARCGYAEIDAAGEALLSAEDWSPTGLGALAGRYPLAELQPELVACWRAGRIARIEAPEPGHRSGALAPGPAGRPCAGLSAPLLRDGALAGALFVQASAPRVWIEDDEETLRFAAEAIWTALGRSRAEARLRESEARLRLALDAGRMAVWAADAAGDLETNPELNRLLGLPADVRPTREALLARFPAEEQERLRSTAMEALARGERYFEVEHRYQPPDGETRWLLLRAEILRGEAGGPRGAIGVVLDVTERRRADERRRRAEQELRDSESRLRMAQAVGGIGAFELLPEQGLILTSEAFCHLWGLPVRDEYPLRELLHQVHPDDLPLIRTRQPDVVGADLRYREYRIRRADTGEERWMARTGQVVTEDGGRQRFLGVSYDITDRKRAEIALQGLNETLEAQVAARTAERDRMWRLSAELMLVADLEGRVEAINPAWETVLGLKPEEVIGRDGLDLMHPDDVKSTRRELAKLADGAASLHFEQRLKRRDGDYRLIAWTAVPEAGHIHGIGRDVTEERAAAETLRRTEEALRQSQKMEAVGQLTGGIAHDFNNMLAIIIGSLDLAERRLTRGQAAERYLDSARDGALRAAALTQRLLAFSRQQPLSPQVMNLNRLVGSMSDLLQRTLGETMALETVLAAGLWSADVDPNQLESALVNLAVNARDAMPEGGLLTVETANADLADPARAEAAGIAPGQYVTVSVGDQGSGMSPEVRARVFDPFFTTKPVGQGTGLGLSMVYGFVTQSGGHVTIDSALGAGTTVKIYLPRHLGAVAENAARRRPAGKDLTGGEVVLVVEDEDRVRQMSVEALSDLGYAVHAAASGEEALRLMEALPDLDLLFTDVVMPGMGGQQLAKIAAERAPQARVLFTTGYAPDAAAHGDLLEPGVALLPKPFSIADLAAKVRGVLDG
jgi:PAS domain S-box-containing protein